VRRQEKRERGMERQCEETGKERERDGETV
jgi:hypothetical protein